MGQVIRMLVVLGGFETGNTPQRAALCLSLLVCMSCVTGTKNTIEPPFTLLQVGPNVWAAISNPKSKTPAWANVGFVIGDESVAVIDATISTASNGNFDTEPAQLLLAAIRRLTTLPVTVVINTHYHVDHIGANAVFVNAGATVLSHHNVHRWIYRENLRMLGNGITSEQKAFIQAMLPPTVTYDQTVDLHLGSRRITLQSFPGHTGGDSVVVIPDANVVFAGDLLWRNMLPNMTDASTKEWIDTLVTLEEGRARWTFVPGHGDVGTSDDIAAFREYLRTLRKLVSDTQAIGKSGKALVDAVMPSLRDKYQNLDGFDYLARPNIVDTEAELNGNKRVPQPLQSDR
jgi:cyclase